MSPVANGLECKAMNKKFSPGDRKTVVYTTKAKCRDCYRCVRVCPVHAIKMEDGQAQVITENCIACGTCITECPQHAKTYTTDYGKVLQMLEGENSLMVSLAPSFAGYFTKWEQKRIPSALRALGFNYVAETAVGAWHVANASFGYIKDHEQQNHICTSCPAIVNYINIYMPQYSGNLVPVSSPMIAHARLLKKEFPRAKFVFIGPCVAKKDEAFQYEKEHLVDAVLTFDELEELFKLKNIKLDSCEESQFDQEVTGDARLFPLEGGLLRTAGMPTDMLDSRIIAVSGFEEIKEVLESMKGGKQRIVIDPLFCRHGCINGPVANRSENIYDKRSQVLDYASKSPGVKSEEVLANFTKAEYHGKPLKSTAFTEDQIKEVLAVIGKHSAEDELNCMACGYNSCREKAVAVLEGVAEPEMCMPYMRRVSEQKFETLIQYDPNGIVTLDKKLEIVHMNEAFKKMFACSDSIYGKNISYLIDPEPFEKITTGSSELIRENIHYTNYNITAHVVVYALPEQEQYVGIFMDVTDFQTNQEKLSDIKSETLNKAQELLDHQISMAQDLARFLGEHTAKEEYLLNSLINLTKK